MGQHPPLSYYRWDGVFGAEFTLAVVRGRVRALAAHLLARRWGCLVACDTRFMAGQYALDAYRLLGEAGVPAQISPAAAPLPAVELALEQRRAECALVITAANRPYWFGGMTVLAPAADLPPLDPAPGAAEPPFPPLPLDPSERGQLDLRAPYLERLRGAVDIDAVRRAPLTVIVDPMSGSASGLVPGAFGEGAQARAVEINRETDALFGRQTPQPAEAALHRLRKLAKEGEAHFGAAISADGTALGVADHAGDLVAPLDLALLLARYLSAEHRARGVVVAPAAAEPPGGLRAWEESSGLKVELTSDPAARIADLAARDRGALLVGVTAAGEVTMGRYGATPDATMTALVLAELCARHGQKLRPLVEQARGRA